MRKRRGGGGREGGVEREREKGKKKISECISVE
jgi:hypothetical protein